MAIKHLKTYIRNVVTEISSARIRAAGIVVVKFDDNNDCLVLVLQSSKGYDLPKGRVEDGETPLDCARRETLEETGISDLHFHIGPKSIVIDQCQMYTAKTNQEPALGKNPDTKQFEHVGYKWVSPEQAIRILPRFLARAVKWAIKNVH